VVIIEILLVIAIAGSAVALLGTVRALGSPRVAESEAIGASDPASAKEKIKQTEGGHKCGTCGALQPAENRFCGQCGNPMEKATCSRCGHEISPADRFCGGCGTPIGGKE
jgi:hypothetical protein